MSGEIVASVVGLGDERRVGAAKLSGGGLAIFFERARLEGDVDCAHQREVERDGATLIRTCVCITKEAAVALVGALLAELREREEDSLALAAGPEPPAQEPAP